MKRQTPMLLIIAALPFLAGCTLIYVDGSHNTVSNAQNRGSFRVSHEGDSPAANTALPDRLGGDETH